MKLSWEHGGGNYIEHYTAELPKNAQEALLPLQASSLSLYVC